MIRRLSYGLLTALMLACACTKETETTGPCIELTVCCDDPVLTKTGSDGTQDGENKYNENLLSTVDFFFYPGRTPDRNADAVFHVRRNSGQRGSDVFLLDLTSNDINARIFPQSTDTREATVFVIANYPGTLVTDENNLSGTSLSALEAREVETDFVLTKPADYTSMLAKNYKQESFMMSGTAILNLRSRTSNIAATEIVTLSRYACKLTASVKVAESVTLGEAVWKPMLEDMAIYLVNGVNTVRLGGEDPTPHYFSFYDNYKKFAYKDSQDGDKIKPLVGKSGEYYDTHPMYMYPQQWAYGETDEATARVEPYLKLELPWYRSSEGGFSYTQRQCYYKIFIPDDNRGGDYLRHFVRNNWYHLDLDVGLLGADTDDAAVELTGSLFMVPWQNVDREIERQAEIGAARYLSVDKSRYDLHNINSTNIRYTTSHPVEIRNIRATCPYYGTKTSGTARGGKITKAKDGDIYPTGSYYLDYNEASRKALNDGQDWLVDIGSAIAFSHPINNVYTDTNFDYSPFTITFTIAHQGSNDTRYQKEVTIVQSPAIVISALKNSDNTFVNTGITWSGKKIHASEHWGYVYEDGRQIVRSQVTKNEQNQWVIYPENNANIGTYISYFKSLYPDDEAVQNFSNEDFHWRVVWYTGGSLDLFKVDVTVLPDNSDFVIGDPRTDQPVDLGEPFKTADALEGGQRSLTWYYPAEKSSRTSNMIAPGFRFASKCGGVEFDNLNETQAKLKCAAFQEDGFPAGRWRLPTKGEIRFIAQLSANGAFEYLFSNNQKYWSANGAIKVNNGQVDDVSDATALTRCVYDAWYWGDTQTNHPTDGRAHFYWGDAER